MNVTAWMFAVPRDPWEDEDEDNEPFALCRCHFLQADSRVIARAVAMLGPVSVECDQCESNWHWGSNNCVCAAERYGWPDYSD